MSYRALASQAAAQCPCSQRPPSPQRVQRYLGLAMKAARMRDSAHEIAVTQLCAAEIAWRLNQAAQARALLDEAVGAFMRMQMAWHLEQAAQLRQQLDSAAQTCSA